MPCCIRERSRFPPLFAQTGLPASRDLAAAAPPVPTTTTPVTHVKAPPPFTSRTPFLPPPPLLRFSSELKIQPSDESRTTSPEERSRHRRRATGRARDVRLTWPHTPPVSLPPWRAPASDIRYISTESSQLSDAPTKRPLSRVTTTALLRAFMAS